MTTADAIKRFRKNFNYSQQKAAELLGMSQPAFVAYEKDNGSAPNGDTLIKMSKVFGVSTDYLLGLSDNPYPNDAPPPSNDTTGAAGNEENKIDELQKRLDALEGKMTRLEKIINF